MRELRYVYHIAGHFRAHIPDGDTFNAPFEYVVQLAEPIVTDEAFDQYRLITLRADIQHEASAGERAGGAKAPIVGDVMIRSLSFLHTIQVEGEGPDKGKFVNMVSK